MNTTEKTIRDAVKRAKEAGIKIVNNDWGVNYQNLSGWNSEGACCALGCLVLLENPEVEDQETAAARLLGVGTWWVDSFMRGFDGDSANQTFHNPDAYELGRTIGLEEGVIWEEE